MQQETLSEKVQKLFTYNKHHISIHHSCSRLQDTFITTTTVRYVIFTACSFTANT